MADAVVAVSEIRHTSIKKITFAWISDGDGDAVGSTAHVYDGAIIALMTIPDGVAAPSDNYDVEIKDADGHDVLLGCGSDRDETNAEGVTTAMGAVAGSKLTLNVSGAGDTKKGTVILWLR